MMETVKLKINYLDEMDFSPYGQMLSVGKKEKIVEPEKGVYVSPSIGQIDISGGRLVFNFLTVERCPLIVETLERHKLTSQTVIPLMGSCGVYAIAPPSKDNEGPDLDRAFAVFFNGSQGINLKKGTWHSAPLAFAATSSYIMVMGSETFKGDLELVDLKRDRERVFEIII
jgi:ureidoglycolate lyase